MVTSIFQIINDPSQLQAEQVKYTKKYGKAKLGKSKGVWLQTITVNYLRLVQYMET